MHDPHRDEEKDSMEAPAIQTWNLTRRFGTFTAIDQINLKVRHGQYLDSSARTVQGKPPQ